MAFKKAGKMTPAQDDRYDRKHGLKEGGAKDNALDRRRGLPVKAAPKHKK